jgi:hypothetical protein
MDTFNIIAGSVGIIAFALAVWQYQAARNASARSRERMALQQQKNESALRTAIIGAQNANLIVQRAKCENVTVAELQSIARSTRGILLYLAQELESQAKVLEAWRFGRDMVESVAPDVPEEKNDDIEPESASPA